MPGRSLVPRIGGLLAIVSGSLILASGFSAHGFSLTLLEFVNEEGLQYLPTAIAPLLQLVLQILGFLIGLGGLTVVAGGIAILQRHILTGRLLIMLGGGAGFIGLLFLVSYTIIVTGVSAILLNVEYWSGLLLAAISRWLAKRK